MPTFSSDVYDYGEICGIGDDEDEGELEEGTAAIYCGITTLSYEDPTGNYKTVVTVTDKAAKTATLDNIFKYTAMTAFDTDFTKINYGNIDLNVQKEIIGDANFDATDQGPATVRNTGNTRLDIKANQTDMGLGKTNGEWNVLFDSRVGSVGPYTFYDPGITTQIAKTLNLSEANRMDFSIKVFAVPQNSGDSFTGTMTLTGASHSQLTCS